MVRKNSRSRVVRLGMERRAAIVLGVAGMASLGACGRSDVLYKDDQYGAYGTHGGSGGGGGTIGTGASGGTVAHTGGTGFGGTGGTGGTLTGGTGGTGGTVSKGGGPGKGGTGGAVGVGGSLIVGGTGGSGGTTAGAAGMSGQGPYACAHVSPTCDTFTNFSTDTGQTWGIGGFTGGISVFGAGITRDTAEDRIHVTGTVTDYGEGIGIYFTSCANLSGYAGVYFTMSGMTGDNDEFQISPLTNSDYSWEAQPMSMIGGCTPSNLNPSVDCTAPDLIATLYSSRQYAYWSDFSGGTPVSWNSATSPNEIVGVEWIFPYDPTLGSYSVDVTLDDVGFIRSGSAAPDCGPAMVGAGGMGGMAGFAGMATAGTGNLAGFAGVGAGGMAGGGGFSGDVSSGGVSTGGVSSGGVSTGGLSSGGISSGGDATGGVATGGQATAGMAGGGVSSGGLSGSGD
ncbi:MAG TPA: hypothetical protein VMI54_00800 [Polyangiaceae bacterium]|nr:hypothetical protein [Polyangiaceae bacterium]